MWAAGAFHSDASRHFFFIAIGFYLAMTRTSRGFLRAIRAAVSFLHLFDAGYWAIFSQLLSRDIFSRFVGFGDLCVVSVLIQSKILLVVNSARWRDTKRRSLSVGWAKKSFPGKKHAWCHAFQVPWERFTLSNTFCLGVDTGEVF